MAIWSNWFKKETTENKEVPENVAFSDTMTRGAISKAYYPGFLIKPPFGWPKFKNVFEIRRVAGTPQAAMAIQTVIDEIVSIPWDIIPKEGFSTDDPVTQAHIDEVKQFLDNPNSNKESLNYILKLALRDLLELDSGIIVKEFNEAGQMVEIRSVDAAGFLKNPDPFGKFTTREDLIIEDFVNIEVTEQGNTIGFTPATNVPGGLSVTGAANKAAYFQYGYLTSARPVPFGKREIVWMEEHPVSFDIYGRSAIENLIDVLNTLIYSILYNLEYFEDNNVPKGFIQLAGANKADLKDFQDKWNDLQLLKDPNSGKLRKIFHKVPITNSPNASFQRIQFSAQELELISSQTWFTKLTWAMLGVTPSELGFTEDSNRASEIVQSRVFRRRGILPRLALLEYHFNKEIISEFEYDDIEFRFNTFDTEEETTKWKLYDLQLKTKAMTINEIRKEEGIDEVEWGDTPQQTSLMGSLNPVQDASLEGQEDNLEKDKQKEIDNKALSVGQTTGNVTLDENEIISQFNKLLTNKQKDILNMVRTEAKRDRLSKIRLKGLDELARRVDDLLGFGEIRNMVMKAIEELFNRGWSKSENMLEEKATQPADHVPIRPNQEQIKFIQQMTFDNIKGASADLKNKLKQELRRAVIEGEGVGKVVNRIVDVFDTGKTRAEKIVRTELNRAQNQGSLQRMKKSNIVKTKTWSSANDSRTSALCKRLDGQTVGINEQFKDKEGAWEAPPSHVNCRSSLLYDVEE